MSPCWFGLIVVNRQRLVPPPVPQQVVADIPAAIAATAVALNCCCRAMQVQGWYEIFLFFEVMQGFVVPSQAKLIRGSDFGVCSRARLIYASYVG